MRPLSDYVALARTPGLPLGTVVHVGAGSGTVLAGYRSLAPQQLILVEGDPDAATELRRRTIDAPWIDVCPYPVAATAGLVTWHRYSMPSLNGPADATALRFYYPRLREIERRELQALEFAEVLVRASTDAHADACDALVLDVPGQEQALLAALTEEQLLQYDIVVLRSVTSAAHELDEAPATCDALLQTHCYDIVSRDAEHEPLWPVTVFRLDRERHANTSLRCQLAAVHDHLREREQTLQTLHTEYARLLGDNEAHAQAGARQQQHVHALEETIRALRYDLATQSNARVSAEQLANERSETLLEALTQCEQQTAISGQHASELRTLTEAAERLEGSTREQQNQITQLTLALGTSEATATELEQRLAHATQDLEARATALAEQELRLRQSEEERTALQHLLLEQIARSEALERDEAAAVATAADLGAQLADALRTLGVQRDQHRSAVSSLEAQLELYITKSEQGEEALAQGEEERSALERRLAEAQHVASELREQLTGERQELHTRNLLLDQLRNQVEALTNSKNSLLSQLTDRTSEMETLRLDREAFTRRHEQQAEELRRLEDHVATLMRRADESTARHTELSAALEGALDRANALTQSTSQRIEDITKERDQQAQWHYDNAKWAKSLLAEKEALEASQHRLMAEHKALVEDHRQLESARDELARTTAERDARQHLLDAEILKAEAQLELIKDVLLREKSS